MQALGETDVLVSVKGAEVDPGVQLGSTTGVEYFSQLVLPAVGHELTAHENLIDGVAPAIVESLAVQDLTTHQNEPRITLFASEQSHLAAFGDIRRHGDGDVQYLNDLRAGEVYLNADGAEELGASAGDHLRLFAEGGSIDARVRAIVDYRGTGTDGPALLMPLGAAQTVLHRDGQIRYVMISALGGELDGAALTDEVIAALNPTLKPFGLEADPVKQDALDEADAEGNAFMSVFTTFGSFSIFAGAMLIFLIFVMLAAERRGELGIARAVGTRRGHLVQMYVYEGMAYDLMAAAVGALLGVAIAFGMVFVIASALDFTGLEIQHDARARSLVVALSDRRAADVPDRDVLGLAGQPPQHRRGDPQHARAARAQVTEAALDPRDARAALGCRPYGFRPLLRRCRRIHARRLARRDRDRPARARGRAAGATGLHRCRHRDGHVVAAALRLGGGSRGQGAQVGHGRLDHGWDLRSDRSGVDADLQCRRAPRRADRHRRPDPRADARSEDGDRLSRCATGFARE